MRGYFLRPARAGEYALIRGPSHATTLRYRAGLSDQPQPEEPGNGAGEAQRRSCFLVFALGILDHFFDIPKLLLGFAFGLFLQTLRLLLLVSKQLPGLLLRFAGDVFDSALDLVFVHDCFSLKRIERIATNVNQLMTHGLTLRNRQGFICALAHIDSIFQHGFTVRAANPTQNQLRTVNPYTAVMQLQDILYSQGFGTRRVCAGLIQQGLVQVYASSDAAAPLACTQAAAEFAAEGLRFRVQGVDWPYHEKAYLMLHKPTAIECSQKPSTYPSIYTLLPTPLRLRPQKGAVQGVQAIGRLDQDTTGLLLLSDDGKFIHRMSSPRHHVPKVYEVTVKHAVDDKQIQKLLAGVVLDDDPKPVRAAACEKTGELQLSLTLTEGKYHQVKRMIAAVGNRVEGLHRSQIGALTLPADLKPGEWRWLTPADLASIAATPGDK